MNIFCGNSLWQLVCQSDTVSKLVLLLLLMMSIICWAIFIGKFALLHLKKRQLTVANNKAKNAKTVTDLTNITVQHPHTMPSYFIAKNIIFVKEILHGNLAQPIHSNDWEMIEKNMDNTIDELLLHNEELLSILSSIAAVAPLLGLFGTVWGLVHSFMRISETQIADIATVAPGIAEALITTLAGLIVAIPALIMFNCLQTKIHSLEYSLITLANRMTFIFQQHRER